MSARFSYIENRMAPAIGARLLEGVEGLLVSDAIAKAGWEIASTAVLVRDEKLVKRIDWDVEPIRDDEELFLIVMPYLNRQTMSQIESVIGMLILSYFAPGIGTYAAEQLGLTGVTVLGVSAASLISTAVFVGGSMLISSFVPTPKPFDSSTSPSPTYSLNGGANGARLGQAIPDSGGCNMIMCDLFTAPYVEYLGNQQQLSVGLMVGIGEYDIQQIRFAQGIIWQDGAATGAYPEVEIEICGPDDPVTLIEDNVQTSAEVNGAAVLGTNEAGADWVGPFVCNRAGTKASSIGIDFFFPSGLFSVDSSSGQTYTATVAVEVDVQQIDNLGNPIGSWTNILSGSFVRSVRDPLRVTHRMNVAPGRYWARMKRTNDKAAANDISDTLQWLGMRAYLPSVVNYPGYTKVALRATATANVNSDSLSKVNVICTRKLPIYSVDIHGVGSWSAPTATRNPAWYAAYLLRDIALGNLPDSRLPLDQLVSLAATWDSRGDWFDGVFDERKSLWENLQSVLAVGRARPFLAGSTVAIVRDEPKSVPTAGFNPRNMLPGSFSIDYTFNQDNAVDALLIQFVDNRTWSSNQVLCALSDFTGDEEDAPPFQFFGITDRDHAFREGMYMVAQNRYRRRSANFKTAREGLVCFLGSPIVVGHWLPTWSHGAAVLSAASNAGGDIITLSEPWSVPAGKTGEAKLVTILAPDGRPYGPVTFNLLNDGSDTSQAQIQLTSTYVMPDGDYAGMQPHSWPIWTGDGLQLERPRAMIGTASEQPQPALLVSMKPDTGSETASLVAVIDDARVYTADEATPPVEVGGPESTLGADLTITGVTVSEATNGGHLYFGFSISGASDATSFDCHWKRPTDAAFTAPLTGCSRVEGGVLNTAFSSPSVTTMEWRAKGAAGYGPWYAVTFYWDGTTDTTPSNVGAVTDNTTSGVWTTGVINHWTWVAVSGAATYLVQLMGRVTGSASFVVMRGPIEVPSPDFYYYPSDEIDDGGPFHNAYLQVKAKNSAGTSAAWTDSAHGT